MRMSNETVKGLIKASTALQGTKKIGIEAAIKTHRVTELISNYEDHIVIR